MREVKILPFLLALMLTAAAFAVTVLPSDSHAAEGDDPGMPPGWDYDGTVSDLGQKYSMKLQLVWTGSDSSRVVYEVSDGTVYDSQDDSANWNPQHEFAAEGIYYIKLTGYNSYQGGSEDIKVYRVEIMGYPEIHFEENGGSSVADMEQTAFNVPAQQPDDPVRDGFTFTGWYTDADCSQPFDWASSLKKDITLYAGWSETAAPSPGGDESQDGDENESQNGNGGNGDEDDKTGTDIPLAAAGITVLGLVALIAGLRSGNMWVAMVASIILIVGIMSIYTEMTAGETVIEWIQNMLGGGKDV